MADRFVLQHGSARRERHDGAQTAGLPGVDVATERGASSPGQVSGPVRLWPAHDLATGAAVTLIESSAGGATEQLRWTLRCGRLASVHHAHLAALLDYGPIGEGRRFEAWRGRVGWRGERAAGERARQMADAYLAASDLAPCVAPLLGEYDGRPVVIPDSAAGREACGGASRALAPGALDACGIESIARPAVEAIVELLESSERQAPGAIALWGEPGCGLRTATRSIARVARLHGFVPIDTASANPAVWDLIGDRSVLMIDREGSRAEARGWQRLLERTTRRPRAHLLVLAGSCDIPGVHSVRLEPIARAALVDAVRPEAWRSWAGAAIEGAADRAGGCPARFASALWRAARPGSSRALVSLAAERAPDYAGSTPAAPPGASARALSPPGQPSSTSVAGMPATTPQPVRAWPVSGQVAALRKKLNVASAALASGRLVRAEREVRSLVGALARRQDWGAVSSGAIALARALASRGRRADARRWLDDAGAWAERAGDVVALGAVSLAVSALHVEEGTLAESESAARAVLAAAASRQDRVQGVQAAVALSRALFWQGRAHEALECLAAWQAGASDDEIVWLASASARASLGLSTGARAHAWRAQATAAAERSGDPALQARAAVVAAFVHLADDDRGSARQAATVAVASARRAREPMLCFSARLLAVEAERREGRSAAAARLLAHVARLPPATLGATVRARVTLLRDLLAGAPPAVAAARIGDSTGLRALVHFAPPAPAHRAASTTVEDVLTLVGRMHAAEDEAAALAALCAATRTLVRAAGVGFAIPEGPQARIVTSDGARLDAGLAGRVLTAHQAITIHPPAGGVEMAIPVRFGERTLGALAARWSAGATPADRAPALLEMTAALAAPSLAAVGRPPARGGADEIIGDSEAARAMRQAIERAAPVPYPVLVEGESGSGKELVARALHRRGPRRDRPFVAVNCAAIPDDLIEAELFGHARGAFTGAMTERAGVFEEAHGGTLFLDEIGELSLRAQAKLLRTLQESEVRRVGENVSRRVDVRIVAATNRNLRSEVAAGRFRLDLLYRLDVVRIVVPPLRERASDLPLLIERSWREATDRVHSRAVLSAATLAALGRYHWPGNVRELQNVMASLAVRAPRRGVVGPAVLPWRTETSGGGTASLEAARRQFEARFVQDALARHGGHRARAAAELGVTRQGLAKLMARLCLVTSQGDTAGLGSGTEAADARPAPPRVAL